MSQLKICQANTVYWFVESTSVSMFIIILHKFSSNVMEMDGVVIWLPRDDNPSCGYPFTNITSSFQAIETKLK